MPVFPTPDRRIYPVCRAFNEMARRLQESISRTCRDEASRRELLAGISHDLRSPLTSIRAYVEGLLDGVARTPARQRKYLETIRSKTEDIDRLVSQLFLFSELELDDYPQLIQRVELSQWISRLIGEVQSDYLRQGLAIRMQLTPAAVEADPEQLRRVLLNLLDNSAKYKDKPDGMAEITVAVRKRMCPSVWPMMAPAYRMMLFPGYLTLFIVVTQPVKIRLAAAGWALQSQPGRCKTWVDISARATAPAAG